MVHIHMPTALIPAEPSLILLHKALMELLKLLHKLFHLFLPGQNGGPQVERSFLLAEATARYCADTSLLQQPEAVEHIWGFAGFLGSSNGFGWQLQLQPTGTRRLVGITAMREQH